jgi:hypothetical protein
MLVSEPLRVGKHRDYPTVDTDLVAIGLLQIFGDIPAAK